MPQDKTVVSLNEKIQSLIENSSYEIPVLGGYIKGYDKIKAADEIEKLILQEKIDLLCEMSGAMFLNQVDSDIMESKINELTTELNKP